MGRKLAMWRVADRNAHDAEMHIRSFGRRYGYMVPPGESDRAQELRNHADRLFEEAMLEINREVKRAVAREVPRSP